MYIYINIHLYIYIYTYNRALIGILEINHQWWRLTNYVGMSKRGIDPSKWGI